MADEESPSQPGHVPGGEATPRESTGSRERELTEYRVPRRERDQPGAREREREDPS